MQESRYIKYKYWEISYFDAVITIYSYLSFRDKSNTCATLNILNVTITVTGTTCTVSYRIALLKEEQSGQAGMSFGFFRAQQQDAKAPARVHWPSAMVKLTSQRSTNRLHRWKTKMQRWYTLSPPQKANMHCELGHTLVILV